MTVQHTTVSNYMAGDALDLVFTIPDVATLSGVTWEWQLWTAARPGSDAFQGWTGASAVLTKTSGAGEIVATLDGTTATVTVALDEDETDGLKGLYYSELKMDGAGDGDRTTPAWGYIEITAAAF